MHIKLKKYYLKTIKKLNNKKILKNLNNNKNYELIRE